jgi:hypothetical protein
MSKSAKLKKYYMEELVPYFGASNKKPLLTQVNEVASLYRKYHFPPYQYVKSGLYKKSAPKDILSFIPPKIIGCLQDKLNTDTQIACNKHMFGVFFESKGLEVVREIIRVFPSGVIHDSDQNEISKYDAEQIIATNGTNVFVKPNRGSFGEGAFIHETSAPTDHLLEVSADTLVQPIIQQHEVVHALHPHSVNTVRLVTLLHDNQVNINAAVLKIGNGGGIVDNSGAGGLVSGIDMKTGRLFPTARQRAVFGQEEYENHPDTGVAFASVTVPFWTDVMDLVSKAAIELPQLPTLGWDVAIMPTGPILVEANCKWNVTLMQDGWGGMGETRIGKLAIELCG